MSSQPSSSGEARYPSAPNRSGQAESRLESHGLIPPPRVGDALSEFLSSGQTARRRNDRPVPYSEPAAPFSNLARPAPSRMNSFASIRPSGSYYQNPFNHIPSYAQPFQDNSPFNRVGTTRRPNPAPSIHNVPGPPQRPQGFVAHDPFRPSHGKKHDKVPEDLTFDDVDVAPSSSPAQALPLYTSPYGPGEIIPNYGSNQYVQGELSTPWSQPPGPQSHPTGYSPYQPPAPPQSQPYDPARLRPRPLSQSAPAAVDHVYTGAAPTMGTPFSPQTPVYQRPGIGGETTSSTPPPAQAPLRTPQPLSSTYDYEAAQATESTPFSYPPNPTSPPVRPTNMDDRMSMLSPIREDGETSGNMSGHLDPHTPAHYDPYHPQDPSSGFPPRPPSPVVVPNTGVGAGFGSIPDLNDDDDAASQKKTWWDIVKSFLTMAAIIIILPVLYPVDYVWKRVRQRKLEYAEVGSITRVPSRVDKAVSHVAGVPRMVYHHMLLRLPSLYFSRVARIFEEADLSLGDLKTMALESASKNKATQVHAFSFEMSTRKLPPAYESLKHTWEEFISSLLREWKTFNLISVLLLSAILTILQIDAANEDPYTRYFALSSLVCALVSLLYGCVYIIRFGTMRKPYKAAEWALEAKKSRTVFYWNVWVLLAMPAVYLAWSLLLFICCIMSFVWRTGVVDGSADATTSTPSGPQPYFTAHTVMRGVVSGILALGCIFGVLIGTTFRRYGQRMDRAWRARIHGWIEEKAVKAAAAAESEKQYLEATYGPGPYPFIPPMSPQNTGGQPQYGPPAPQQPDHVARPDQQQTGRQNPAQHPPLRHASDDNRRSWRRSSNGLEEDDSDEDDDGQDMTSVVAASLAPARVVGQGQQRDPSAGLNIPRASSPESMGSLRLGGVSGQYAIELLNLAEQPSAKSTTRPQRAATPTPPTASGSRNKSGRSSPAIGLTSKMKKPLIAVHQPLGEDDDASGNGTRKQETDSQRLSDNRISSPWHRSAASGSVTHTDSHIGFAEIPPTPQGTPSPNPSLTPSLPPPTPPLPTPTPLPLPPPQPPANVRKPLRVSASDISALTSTKSTRRTPPLPPRVPPPLVISTKSTKLPFVPPPPPPPLPKKVEQSGGIAVPETVVSGKSSNLRSGSSWLLAPTPGRLQHHRGDREAVEGSTASSPGRDESEGGRLIKNDDSDTGSPVRDKGKGTASPFGSLGLSARMDNRRNRVAGGSSSSWDAGNRGSEREDELGELRETDAFMSPPSPPSGSGSGNYSGSLLLSPEIAHRQHVRKPSDSEGDPFGRKSEPQGVGLEEPGEFGNSEGGSEEDEESKFLSARLDVVIAKKNGTFRGRGG